jgi:hypothetical protein
MEVRGEAEMSEGEEMQIDGPKKVVYVLHPNCNVENFVGVAGEQTQVVE